MQVAGVHHCPLHERVDAHGYEVSPPHGSPVPSSVHGMHRCAHDESCSYSVVPAGNVFSHIEMQAEPPPQAMTQPETLLHDVSWVQPVSCVQHLSARQSEHCDPFEGTPQFVVASSPPPSVPTPPLELLPLLPLPPPPLPAQPPPTQPSTGGCDEEEEQAKARSTTATALANPRALRIFRKLSAYPLRLTVAAASRRESTRGSLGRPTCRNPPWHVRC